MKTNVLLSTLVLTMSLSSFAQVTDGDGPGNASNKEICKSSDPFVSAESIECYPESNVMIIHKPKFKYMNQQLNIGEDSSGYYDVSSICHTFGSEDNTGNKKVKFYAIYSYVKEGIKYYGKNRYSVISQADISPIKSIQCELVDRRRRAQLDDDGLMKCFDRNPDGSRGTLFQHNDFCAYDGGWRKNSKGQIHCYSQDFLGVAYGKPRMDHKWCKDQRINPNLEIDPTLE